MGNPTQELNSADGDASVVYFADELPLNLCKCLLQTSNMHFFVCHTMPLDPYYNPSLQTTRCRETPLVKTSALNKILHKSFGSISV